jgi:hypothetical protein
MKLKHFALLAVTSGLIFVSCGGNKQPETQETSTNIVTEADTTPYNELADFKFFFTIANLPSPLEIINTIYTTEVPYNKDLLNSDENFTKYQTTFKKAVNYGIYGVDMAYISTYGKKQDMLDYFVTIKKIAKSLGVEQSFINMSERFEANEENKDSLMKLIDQVYAETDSFMKNNKRLLASSQVLAGAFTESIYLSSTLMKDQERNSKNEAVFNGIYEQRGVLENLVKLFQEFKDDKESAKLLTDLEDLQKVYSTISDPAAVNKATLTVISGKVTTLRDNLIK